MHQATPYARLRARRGTSGTTPGPASHRDTRVTEVTAARPHAHAALGPRGKPRNTRTRFRHHQSCNIARRATRRCRLGEGHAHGLRLFSSLHSSALRLYITPHGMHARRRASRIRRAKDFSMIDASSWAAPLLLARCASCGGGSRCNGAPRGLIGWRSIPPTRVVFHLRGGRRSRRIGEPLLSPSSHR